MRGATCVCGFGGREVGAIGGKGWIVGPFPERAD